MTNQEVNNGETKPRIFLQPIAAPSILGLYGFAGATFIVAAHMAGWYGDAQSALYLFPFAAMFGGVAQFLAGMWAYHARDGLATAMHGMWGSFWIAYGILNLMFATGSIPKPAGGFGELGFWFVVLAAITWAGTVAATAENAALTSVLAFLAAGSTLAAIGNMTNNGACMLAAGYLFIISSFCAFYTASALMFEESMGRSLLPIGKAKKARRAPDIAIGIGEPGVIRGQ